MILYCLPILLILSVYHGSLFAVLCSFKTDFDKKKNRQLHLEFLQGVDIVYASGSALLTDRTFCVASAGAYSCAARCRGSLN
jgi:hypothetical protein